MKALTLWQPWAGLIAEGHKTVETRRWRTSYRGSLVICSAQKTGADIRSVLQSLGIIEHLERPRPVYLVGGRALAVVTLVDCRRMAKADEAAAKCPLYPGAWAWILRDIQPIEEPWPEVTGKQRLWDCDLFD